MKRSGYFLRDDDLVGIFKAEGDAVDYAIDWSAHLAEGIEVASATWVVPAGVTGSTEALESPITKKRISGGTAGQEYPITCQMTKTNGERIDRTFVVVVVEALS